MATLTPMTELEAVNEMLYAIGEMSVNSIDDTQLTESKIAQDILTNVSRSVQAEGLNCNTVYNYTLNPDSNNKIPVPSNALSVNPMDRTKDLMVHKGFLYDKDGFINKFDEPVEVQVVFLLQFEDLPEHCRQYITIRAARIFQKRMVGSGNLHDLTAEEEQRARINMRIQEVENEDNNMLQGYLAYQGSIRRGSIW